MYGSSGCLGCYNEPKTITKVDKPLERGSSFRGQVVKKPIRSGDFWTTRTCDMDNSAAQSQGSMSSISTINQLLDPHSSSFNANTPSEFVNHGLLLWNQNRQCWLGNKRSENQSQQIREPKLNWNATYDNLLGSNKPFAQPIPLGEMVDFLVDIWEQDGLYD